MIIETSSNEFYAVSDFKDKNLAHVWRGIPVKRTPAGFEPTAKGARLAEAGKFVMVRKAATRIVEA